MNDSILNELRMFLLNRTDLSSIPEKIWKRTSALNTWGTNALEGSTINWKDAQRILLEERSINDKPMRDVMETVQHERVFRGLLDRKNDPIRMITVLELHEDVFKGVMVDAGRWRNINVRIMGAGVNPPRMEKVIPLMEELIEEYHRRDVSGEEVFTLGGRFHYEFEAIHPFADGNGRIGRLLLNLHFLKHNWPPVHILPIDRDDYLSSLNDASGGNTDILVEFLKEKMGSSLLDMLDSVGTSEDELIGLDLGSEYAGMGSKYLGVLCRNGDLPGILTKHRWKTSRRALDLYIKYEGRRKK